MKKQVPTPNVCLTRGYLHYRIHSVKVPALNDRAAWLAQLFPHIPLWRIRNTKHMYIQDLLLASLQKYPFIYTSSFSCITDRIMRSKMR